MNKVRAEARSALEYVRKFREVRYREALFALLLKQYEAAKIDEGKDVSLIQPLDRAIPPERKSAPHRALICITITLLAFLVGYLWAYFRETLQTAQQDPHFAARLQMLKFYLRRRSRPAALDISGNVR